MDLLKALNINIPSLKQLFGVKNENSLDSVLSGNIPNNRLVKPNETSPMFGGTLSTKNNSAPIEALIKGSNESIKNKLIEIANKFNINPNAVYKIISDNKYGGISGKVSLSALGIPAVFGAGLAGAGSILNSSFKLSKEIDEQVKSELKRIDLETQVKKITNIKKNTMPIINKTTITPEQPL